MEQSPSKADSRSATQEIPRHLQNLNFHYRVHKILPLIPILSQTHPGYSFLLYFFKIHYNILPSTPRSSEWSLPFRFSEQKFYMHFSSLPCVPYDLPVSSCTLST